jgi:hypothetical protein
MHRYSASNNDARDRDLLEIVRDSDATDSLSSTSSTSGSSTADASTLGTNSPSTSQADSSTGKHKPLKRSQMIQRLVLMTIATVLVLTAVYQLYTLLEANTNAIQSSQSIYDGKTQTLYEIPRDDDDQYIPTDDDDNNPNNNPNNNKYQSKSNNNNPNNNNMQQWIDVLRHGLIEQMDQFEPGLANKWLILFQSGHQAVAKPFEAAHHFTSRSLPLLDYSKLESATEHNTEITGMSRAQWHYQGWSEVASFYFDRAFKWHRKPPTTGRFIDVQWAYMNDYSWRGWLFGGSGFIQTFNRWVASFILPSTSWVVGGIPVSVQAWVDGVRGIYLEPTDRQFLTNQIQSSDRVCATPTTRTTRPTCVCMVLTGSVGNKAAQLAQISDTILHHFLLDGIDMC